MDPRTQERVEEWDSRPFSDGYAGLSDLADTGFSGAVSVTGTWLFMLNGRIVGVFEGAIEDFEDGSGTVYQAPHPSLPLLCSMEEQGGETRAQYYTNETPLEEVDETLQDGSFTGYVELSENVLSGDYYAVYYGGRRMAAAYIGNAERLLTGDEAFERAADEVGIYEVIDVDVEVTDVPTSDENDSSGSSATDAPADSSATNASAVDDSSASDDAVRSPTTDDSVSTESGSTQSTDDATRSQDRSGPVADPTESAIEPIDISGSDSATGDADATAESSIEGITGGDPLIDDTEPAGVTTETESAAEPATDDDEPDTVDSSTRDTDGSDTEPAVDETAVDGETDTPDEPTPAPSQSDPDHEQSASDQEPSSKLDPAEVEAAAAELKASEISWQEGEGSVDPTGESDTTASQSDDADAGATETGVDQSGAVTTTAHPPDHETASTDEQATADPDAEQLEAQFEEEAQWRETRRIPSIDPEKTSEADTAPVESPERDAERSASGTVSSTGSDGESTSRAKENGRSGESRHGQAVSPPSDRSQSATRSDSTQRSTQSATRSDSTQRSTQSVDRLKARLERLESEREQLVETAEQLESERDQLRAEKQELSNQVQQLQSRIEDLETELERARAGADADSGTQASTQLSPTDALSGTNLFVRYDSKSQPTLETAHDGQSDREEVASNIRLEHHTEFDESDVAVAGQPYEAFLTSTMAHRFVDWLTEVLLYEIRDTGHADGLSDLYDAIPRIDRAELQSTISLADDDTEDVPDEVTFDVVAYDKMGNPLALVTLNDSREPATKEMLAELEEAASAVKANYPELAAAIAVTSSYFDPGALEVTEQATSASLLSRSSKASYVNLSRKQGYHLCLVESRSEGFHMTVPEL